MAIQAIQTEAEFSEFSNTTIELLRESPRFLAFDFIDGITHDFESAFKLAEDLNETMFDMLLQDVETVLIVFTSSLAAAVREEWSGKIETIPRCLSLALSTLLHAFKYFQHPIPQHINDRLMSALWPFLADPLTNALLSDIIANVNSKRLSGPEIPLGASHTISLFATILNSLSYDGHTPPSRSPCTGYTALFEPDGKYTEYVGSIQILLQVMESGAPSSVISTPSGDKWMLPYISPFNNASVPESLDSANDDCLAGDDTPQAVGRSLALRIPSNQNAHY